jgi:hypothetical protein
MVCVALDDVHQVPEEGTPQLFSVGSLPPMLKRTTEASGVNSVEKLNTVLIEPSFPLLTELFPIMFGRGKASHSYEVSGVIPTRVEGENQGHTPILPSYARSWEPPAFRSKLTPMDRKGTVLAQF